MPGTDVWSAVVWPGWSRRLGCLSTWSWLHVRPGHLGDVQPHQQAETDLPRTSACHGGSVRPLPSIAKYLLMSNAAISSATVWNWVLMLNYETSRVENVDLPRQVAYMRSAIPAKCTEHFLYCVLEQVTSLGSTSGYAEHVLSRLMSFVLRD